MTRSNLNSVVLESNPIELIYANNPFSSISNMKERPDLLISLEKIMNRNVPALRDLDLLSSAFSVFNLQDLNEIVVLNNSGFLLGVLRSEVLYSKMPANVLDIPSQFRVRGDENNEIRCNLILDISRKKIGEEFILDKPNRLFQSTEPLSSLLSEINSLHNYYLTQKTIPIFDDVNKIQGVITYKEILKYIEKDSFLRNSTIEDLCESQCLCEYLSILMPEDVLAIAEMIMEYTLTDFIVVLNNEKQLIGYLDKIWVDKLIHYSNFSLLNVTLQDLARPPDRNIQFVTSKEQLTNVIQYLIENNTKILVNSESNNLNSQIRVITPLTIISFFLSSF